jgi:hypothetical protein
VRELGPWGHRRKISSIKHSQRLGFLDSRVKEILFKEIHEQVGIGRGHTGAHGGSLNLEVMSGVKGEMVVGEDKLGELDN